MYSAEAYGEFPYTGHEYVPLDSTGFEAFLADITAPRCFLLELDAFSLGLVDSISAAYSDGAYGELGYTDGNTGVTGGVHTLRFSSQGYISHADDSPAYTWYDARLTNGIRVERSLAGRDGIGGLVRTRAEAELVNDDGALDLLTANYALDGRRARVLIGRPTDALADFGVVFSGVVETATVGGKLRLRLSDGIAKLDLPVNPSIYAGTGGLEGGDDLKGKAKPVCLGEVKNIAPPLVDAAGLVYQVNDGAISDVPAAYDRGIALSKVAAPPGAGEYSVDTTLGTITLGATPAGTVTCNVLGDASLSGYIDRTADIILRILVARAGLTSSEIDPASIGRLNADAPAEVGIWAGTEPVACATVVDELLANVGAFGGFSRFGAFTVALLAAPGGTPADTYTAADILGDITREPLPAPVEPVAWRARVGWQRNYTVQDDLAAAVTDAQRSFAAQFLRVAATEDSAIQSRRLLARDYGPGPGLYADEADAEAEADRLFALWSVPRAQLRVPLPARAMVRDLGEAVHLRVARHGLSAGRPARVIGYALAATNVELMVLV